MRLTYFSFNNYKSSTILTFSSSISYSTPTWLIPSATTLRISFSVLCPATCWKKLTFLLISSWSRQSKVCFYHFRMRRWTKGSLSTSMSEHRKHSQSQTRPILNITFLNLIKSIMLWGVMLQWGIYYLMLEVSSPYMSCSLAVLWLNITNWVFPSNCTKKYSKMVQTIHIS